MTVLKGDILKKSYMKQGAKWLPKMHPLERSTVTETKYLQHQPRGSKAGILALEWETGGPGEGDLNAVKLPDREGWPWREERFLVQAEPPNPNCKTHTESNLRV